MASYSLPDWRDPRDYPSGKNITPKRWAWEFLRRNLAYQADWLENCRASPPEDEEARVSLAAKWAKKITFDWVQRVAHGKPPAPRQAILEAVLSEGINPVGVVLASKWGLKRFVDPFAPYDSSRVEFVISAELVKKASPEWKGFEDESKEALIIDYNLPLKPQLEAVKLHANQHREYLLDKGVISPWPNTRERADKYRDYLRVLDALEDLKDLDHKEQIRLIGEVIWSDEPNSDPDRVRDHAVRGRIRAAKKLRDTDYLYIPTLSRQEK